MIDHLVFVAVLFQQKIILTHQQSRLGMQTIEQASPSEREWSDLIN